MVASNGPPPCTTQAGAQPILTHLAASVLAELPLGLCAVHCIILGIHQRPPMLAREHADHKV